MSRSGVRTDLPDQQRTTRAWSSTAFGLAVQADLPVLGFSDGPHHSPPNTRLERTSAGSIDASWPHADAERLIDRRFPDGRAIMTVDAHPGRGYRIDTPGHGRFRVSADGSLVECAPPAEASWRWHRPLFAQALPLAAALHGMELLHASGVTIDGAAIAVVGHSGAGKTSLAVHLTDQGASLLADDVIALSARAGALRAHPGVCFANVASEQLEAMGPGRGERFGRAVGRSDKQHLLVERFATAAAPLRRVYFLDRTEEAPELHFERLRSPGPRRLFATAFLSHVTTPARMKAQLEVHSLIAASVPAFRLLVPASLGARDLAPLVAAHSRGAHQPG